MKHGLFWRTFTAIFAVLLVAISLTTVMMMDTQRQNLQARYETEVRTQARQVAELLQQMNRISVVRSNRTIQNLVHNKITSIYNEYNADIWLVNFYSGRVEYIDRNWNTAERITDEPVVEELANIQEGNEIRRLGLFTDQSGESIVTIGVPWTYDSGLEEKVVGAVLLNIPLADLRISLISVLPQAIIPLAVSLVLAIILSTFVARSQIRPIHTIETSVRKYATGNFSSRIQLSCGGELEELADTINNMAGELENLEESRKDFVANVSHELRSPMTSMKGYVQALIDGVIEKDDQPKYLQIILDETNRLTSLVHDLLDLSRLESGRFPMNIAPFNANEMMRRVLVNYAQRIENKHIDVDIQFVDDSNAFVLGDVNRLTQVISNFIDNAVKFMTGSDSMLILKTIREGDSLRICVCDNGPGISKEDLPRIQERFYKVDKSHTAGMGTGLGLSISKTILQQHNTVMDITSEPGVSTVFSFTLKLTKPVKNENLLQSA